MKPLLFVPLFLGLGTAAAIGAVGSEAIIKQHAKDLRDQNNARQGVPPATGVATAPATATPTVTAPAPPTAGQISVGKLQTALAAIKAGTEVTATSKQTLGTALTAAVQGSSKPSPTTVEKLSQELCTALSANQLTSSQRARLAQDLDGLLNPARYPQARKEAIVGDIQNLFQSLGMVRSRAEAIAGAARAAADEVLK